ncbi:MAG: serine hydrolase [Saezia sp.]
MMLLPTASAFLNNGAPSKVAVPMTDPINANLTALTEVQPQPHSTQENRVTELYFEVERVTREPQAPTIIEVNNIQTEMPPITASPLEAVTYAALPNINRRATPSKIAVATAVTPFISTAIQEQSTPATQLIEVALSTEPVSTVKEEQTLENEVAVRVEETTLFALDGQPQQNIRRRPTPSKIAVNATALAPSIPIPEIPPRDASTHFYLSAPSKTPVAALEAMSTRSNALPLTLNASSVLIINQDSREILYSRNPLDSMPIASITKLMTAMVVLDAKQNLNQMITITSADIDILKSTSSRLHVGAKLSRADLLHLTLMSSENRAAHALSRHYPGGKKAFIAAMNAKAQQLGMTHTFYADPTGLSSENRSTARDLVWLVDAAYKYDLIRNLSTSSKHKVTAGRVRLNYTTSNHLIDEKNWTIGLQKTGYIKEAGYCLVMQTQISGKSFIMILLDADAKKNRFNDANSIRRWIAA